MSEIPEEDQKYLRDTYERIQKYLHSSDGPGLLKISEITRHLFISNLSVSCDIEKIRAENIRAVLYIGESDKQQSTLKTYQKKKISYKFINLADNTRSDIISIFEPCYDFIHSFVAKEKKVLVHCVAGVSRSPAVVAYYFLKRYYFVNFSKGNSATQRRLISRKWYILPEIIAMIKNSRPCIEPNGGFVQKLILMEYQLKRYFDDVYHNDPARLKEKSLAKKLDILDTLDMEDSDDENEKKDARKDAKEDEYDDLKKLEDIDP